MQVSWVDSCTRRCWQALLLLSFQPILTSIFSVKEATSKGATVNFKQGNHQVICKNGTKFDIQVYFRLYYLDTFDDENGDNEHGDASQGCYDIRAWHRILGHCKNMSKLEKVVNEMNIKGKINKSVLECETCTQGKFTQSRNRDPDTMIHLGTL